MTDYGAIIYGDQDGPKYPDNDPPPRKSEKPVRCSTSNNLGLFIRHLTNLRQVLKAADKDGFCLDELLNALPDFEVALKSSCVG